VLVRAAIDLTPPRPVFDGHVAVFSFDGGNPARTTYVFAGRPFLLAGVPRGSEGNGDRTVPSRSRRGPYEAGGRAAGAVASRPRAR
jgi:hypothetical protein